MTDPAEQDVNMAAAHILHLLDLVQEQLASIRKTAEQLGHQQEGDDGAVDA